jgi:hypothetical protein
VDNQSLWSPTCPSRRPQSRRQGWQCAVSHRPAIRASQRRRAGPPAPSCTAGAAPKTSSAAGLRTMIGTAGCAAAARAPLRPRWGCERGRVGFFVNFIFIGRVFFFSGGEGFFSITKTRELAPRTISPLLPFAWWNFVHRVSQSEFGGCVRRQRDDKEGGKKKKEKKKKMTRTRAPRG